MLGVLYVLHKKPDGIPGGTELHTLDLIKGLRAGKRRAYLLFPGAASLVVRDYNVQEIKEFKYEVEYTTPDVLKNRSAELAFEKVFDDFPIDIVHFQHLHGLPLSVIEAAQKRGKKVVILLHDYFYWCLSYNLINFANNPVSFCNFKEEDEECKTCLKKLNYSVSPDYVRKRRDYIENLLSSSDCLVAPSAFLRRVFLSLYPKIGGDNFFVIEHGTPKKTFNPCGRGPTFNVAFLGNFTVEKGKSHFLRLADHFRENKGVRFFIIGNLENYFDATSQKNLTVIGGYTRENLPEILRKEAIDVIVLLSTWPETFSYTLSEALSNSIPVIATDLGALRERISRYMVGYLAPYEDPVPVVVRAINDFLCYPELLDYFKQRCIIAGKKLPDTESMIDKYEELYRSLQ